MIALAKESVFTPEFLESGERLLHHQCWFFGRDIHHSQGNLLIRYGFKRFGAPKKGKGANMYHLQLDSRHEIALWGFGIFFSNGNDGIFINRYHFLPKYFPKTALKIPTFQIEELPRSFAYYQENDLRIVVSLLIELSLWICDYEDWVEAKCGKNWRKQCLLEWDNTKLNLKQIKQGWLKIDKLSRKI